MQKEIFGDGCSRSNVGDVLLRLDQFQEILLNRSSSIFLDMLKVKDIISDDRLGLALSNFCGELREDFAERSKPFSFIVGRKFGDCLFAEEFVLWWVRSFVEISFLVVESGFAFILQISIVKFVNFIEIFILILFVFGDFILVFSSLFHESRVKFFHKVGVFSAEEVVEILRFVPENEVVEVENGLVGIAFNILEVIRLILLILNLFFLSSLLNILTINLKE